MSLAKKISIRVGLLLATVFFASCTAKVNEDNSASQLHYIPFGNFSECVIAHALEPAIRVCFKGSGVNQTGKDYTKKGILEWFDAIRPLNAQVTNVVEESCNDPHLTVDIRSGSATAMASCGYITSYETKGYGTYLHELGHALAGLSDTYMGRQAGACKPGHPESIMCWGEYGNDTLYPDDIEGIRAQFTKMGKVDPNAKPQVSTQSATGVFLKLANEGNTSTLLVSTPKDVSTVIVCDGDQTDCTQLNTGLVGFIFNSELASRSIFSSTAPVALAQKTITIVAKDRFGAMKARKVLQIVSGFSFQ